MNYLMIGILKIYFLNKLLSGIPENNNQILTISITFDKEYNIYHTSDENIFLIYIIFP